MDEPLIPCVEVVYKPKSENSEPITETPIDQTPRFQEVTDRFIMIANAARQAFFVGYLDGLYEMSSDFLTILDETGKYYHLDLTSEDDYIMRLHYRLAKEIGINKRKAREEGKQHTSEPDWSYETILKDLEEQQIPCQTLRKIFAGYPDYEQNIKYNKQKTK